MNNNLLAIPTSNYTDTFSATLGLDIKAEVIGAELVESGVPADRIVTITQGALQRSYRKDVVALVEEIAKLDHRDYYLLKTTNEGLYDLLPEGLFHSVTTQKSATEKEIIDAIKQRKTEERNARLFFLPFESAINSLKLQTALYENGLDKRSHYDELVKMFAEYWEIFTYLDKRQADIFLQILPVIHEIRDDHETIQTVLELMFQLPVQITLRPQAPFRPLNPYVSTLDDCRLGVDFTTGNATYISGEDEILINIGPMDNDKFQYFMQGKVGSKILEILSDYLLPVTVDVKTDFILEVGAKTMRLPDKDNLANSSLGVSTYL